MKKYYLYFLPSLILVLFLGFLIFNSKPSEVNASNPCKKNFYTNNDIVGYFRNVKTDESYYITNDWCVVKAILWWGSVFQHYEDPNIEAEIKQNIDDIFPDWQVYFGLLPENFLKADSEGNPRSGAFCTVGLANYGYFTNDSPFKNIFGNNYPQPPKFVSEEKSKTKSCLSQKATPPPSSVAAILMQRMDDLHYKVFVPRITKGQCQQLGKYPELTNACYYFSHRTQLSVPDAYKAFTKAPGEIQ